MGKIRKKGNQKNNPPSSQPKNIGNGKYLKIEIINFNWFHLLICSVTFCALIAAMHLGFSILQKKWWHNSLFKMPEFLLNEKEAQKHCSFRLSVEVFGLAQCRNSASQHIALHYYIFKGRGKKLSVSVRFFLFWFVARGF